MEFDPSQSDGCSVPRMLRCVVPLETQAQRDFCVAHDRAYFYGGSRRERAIADAELLVGLLRAEMDIELAQNYYFAVREFGKPHWNDGRGNKGRYSDDPSAEIAPDPMIAHPWTEFKRGTEHE